MCTTRSTTARVSGGRCEVSTRDRRICIDSCLDRVDRGPRVGQSNHRSLSRRVTTSPTTVATGADRPAAATSSASCPTVLTTTRCADVVPCSTQAAGVVGAAAVADQAVHEQPQPVVAHEDDQRPRALRERLPAHAAGRVLGVEVTGDDADVLGVAAGRHRDAGVRRGRDRAGDAGHDLEGDPGVDERLGLLAAAAEHERVAALEPHHPPARLRVLDQLRVDLLLARRRAGPRGLADVDHLGVRHAGGAASRGRPAGRRGRRRPGRAAPRPAGSAAPGRPVRRRRGRRSRAAGRRSRAGPTGSRRRPGRPRRRRRSRCSAPGRPSAARRRRTRATGR